MKSTILLLSVLCVFFSCNSPKQKIEDPQDYNKIIASVIINVQNPLDSLEFYLIQIKMNLGKDTSKSIELQKDFDTILINQLYETTYERIESGFDKLNRIEFVDIDTVFLASAKKSLEIIQSSLQNDFLPLINILKNSGNQKSINVLLEIIPKGKEGFLNYQRAIDTVIIGQKKFNEKYDNITDKYILRFNF